jgi:hypothetical protein
MFSQCANRVTPKGGAGRRRGGNLEALLGLMKP